MLGSAYSGCLYQGKKKNLKSRGVRVWPMLSMEVSRSS